MTTLTDWVAIRLRRLADWAEDLACRLDDWQRTANRAERH